MVEWPCCHDPLRLRLGFDDLLPKRNNPSSNARRLPFSQPSCHTHNRAPPSGVRVTARAARDRSALCVSFSIARASTSRASTSLLSLYTFHCFVFPLLRSLCFVFPLALRFFSFCRPFVLYFVVVEKDGQHGIMDSMKNPRNADICPFDLFSRSRCCSLLFFVWLTFLF